MTCAIPWVLAVCALALWLSAGAAAVAGPGSEPDLHASPLLDVRVERGELTVAVRDVPLARLLRTIGAQAGVDVVIRGDLSGLVTVSFRGLPLEEGIRRLARGHSLLVTYSGGDEGPSARPLTGIWVLEGSSASRAIPAMRGRELTAPAASQAAGEPSRPRQPAPAEQRIDEPVPDTAVHFPHGGWIEGIQALTDEAERGSGSAVASLTDISASEPSAIVRHQAVAALGRLKGPEIEPALTAALAADDAAIRARAVRGLRGTGTETAVQSLAGVAIGDGDPRVRLAALRALAAYPGPATRQAFAKAFSDPDVLVREAAIRALSWWNTHVPGTP